MGVGERDALVKGGWKLESTAFYAYDTAGAGRLPVYRLGGANGDHMFTTSGYEKDALSAKGGGYNFDSIAFYVSNGASAPATNTHQPSGSLDPSSCQTLAGWALDGDNLTTTVRVDAYIQGVGIATGPTNVNRADINRGFYTSGNHGYNYTIPDKWLDGQPHFADVYGINVDSKGTVNGQNNKIGHREFACDKGGRDHMPEINARRAAEEAAAKKAAAEQAAKAAQNSAFAAAISAASQPTLSIGSTGPAVTAFQQRLANRGFWILADGNFSANTDHWVRAFSIEIGLGNTGVVDARTYGAMNAAEADNWRFNPNDPLLSVLQPATPAPPVVVNPGGNAQPPTGSKCGPKITVAQCEAFVIFITHVPPAAPPAPPPPPSSNKEITGDCRGYADDGGIHEVFGIKATFGNCWNQHNNQNYPHLQHIDWKPTWQDNREIWTRIDGGSPVVVQRNPGLEVGVCRWVQSNGIFRATPATRSQCDAYGPSAHPTWSYK